VILPPARRDPPREPRTASCLFTYRFPPSPRPAPPLPPMVAPCPPTPGGPAGLASSEPSTPSLRVVGFTNRAGIAGEGPGSGAATPVGAGQARSSMRRRSSPPESPLGRLLREQSVPSLPALGLSISTKGCKPTLGVGLRTPASARGGGTSAGASPALRLRSFSHSDLASSDLLLSRSSDPIFIPPARCAGGGRVGGVAGARNAEANKGEGFFFFSSGDMGLRPAWPLAGLLRLRTRAGPPFLWPRWLERASPMASSGRAGRLDGGAGPARGACERTACARPGGRFLCRGRAASAFPELPSRPFASAPRAPSHPFTPLPHRRIYDGLYAEAAMMEELSSVESGRWGGAAGAPSTARPLPPTALGKVLRWTAAPPASPAGGSLRAMKGMVEVRGARGARVRVRVRGCGQLGPRARGRSPSPAGAANSLAR